MVKAKATLLLALLLLLPALGAEHSEEESFLPFLFVTFAITWIAFFVYAFFINRKQADLDREIEMLRAMQEEDNDSNTP